MCYSASTSGRGCCEKTFGSQARWRASRAAPGCRASGAGDRASLLTRRARGRTRWGQGDRRRARNRRHSQTAGRWLAGHRRADARRGRRGARRCNQHAARRSGAPCRRQAGWLDGSGRDGGDGETSQADRQRRRSIGRLGARGGAGAKRLAAAAHGSADPWLYADHCVHRLDEGRPAAQRQRRHTGVSFGGSDWRAASGHCGRHVGCTRCGRANDREADDARGRAAREDWYGEQGDGGKAASVPGSAAAGRRRRGDRRRQGGRARWAGRRARVARRLYAGGAMTITFDDIQKRESQHVLQTYRRQPVAFVRGRGPRLYDVDGREYLDFVSGIGVASLGHAHPGLTAVIADQAATLLHTSNLYFHPFQAEAAGRLSALSGLARTFFCNSGTEANEACLKFARRYWHTQGKTERIGFVAVEQAFAGRSMGALSVTFDEHYRTPFG